MQSSGNGDVALSVTLSTKGIKSDVQKIKSEIEKEVGSGGKISPRGTSSKAVEKVTQDVHNMENVIESAKEQAKSLLKQIDDAKSVQVPTEEYKKMGENAQWLEKELAKANTQLDHMELAGEEGTKKYDQLANKAYTLEEALKNVRGEMQGLVDLDEAFTTGDEGKIAELQSQYDTLADKIALMVEQEQQASRAAQVQDASNEQSTQTFSGLKNIVDGMRESFSTLPNTLNDNVKPALEGIKSVVVKVGEGIKKLPKLIKSVGDGFKRLGSNIKTAISGFRKLIPAIHSTNSGFKLSLKNILMYAFGIHSLFSLFSKLKSVIMDGWKTMAKWNNGNNDVNKSISMLMNSLNQMKNALASAFAPILTVVAPILNYLIEIVTKAANAIAQLIATLTGQSTWLRAKKNAEDFAQGLDDVGGSAKKATGKLAAFDDLNVLGKDDEGGGGGGGVNPGDMFEEVEIDPWFEDLINRLKEMWANADFTELGAILGEKLRQALDAIPWDIIRDFASRLAMSIATFLNGFFETEGLGASIGRTIAEALNTAFLFVYDFARTLHWNSIGEFIGEALLNIVDFIDGEMLGMALGEVLSGVIDLAFHAVTSFMQGGGFNQIGLELSTAINAIFERMLQVDENIGLNAFQQLGQTISTLINGLFTSIYDFARTLHWEQIGQAIGQSLLSMVDSLDGEMIGNAIGEVLRGAMNTAYNTVQAFLDGGGFTQLGLEISAAINGLLERLGQIDPSSGLNAWQQLGQTLSNGIRGLLDTIITSIEQVNWNEIGQAITDFIRRIDFGGVALDLSNLAHAFFTAIVEALQNVDWSMIGYKIGEFVRNINFGQLIGDIISIVATGLDAIIRLVLNFLASLLQPVTDGLNQLYNNISQWWTDLQAAIADFLLYLQICIDNVIQLAQDIIAGFWQGITSKAAWLKSQWDNFWKNVINWFKTIFGIHSPSTVFAEFGQNILQGLIDGINSLLQDLYQLWTDLKNSVVDIVTALKERVMELWTNLKETTFELWTNLKEKVVDIVTNIKQKVTELVQALREKLEEKWNKIKNTATQLWQNIKDTVTTLVENLKNTVKEKIEALKQALHEKWENIKAKAQEIWTVIKNTITEKVEALKMAVRDKIEQLRNTLSEKWTLIKSKTIEVWENIKTKVKDKVTSLKTEATNIVNGLKDKILNIWDTLKNKTSTAFNTIKTNMISIWEKIKDGIKAPINSIITTIENFVNNIISGINFLISKLNTLSISVPDGPWGDGFTWGINIPPLSNITIPRLAQGAVIPPNHEFLAMLGDQKYGTNIEAPLDTIKAAFEDVIGNIQVQNTGNAVMQVDGKTFAKLMTPYVVSELDRRGYNVRILEA